MNLKNSGSFRDFDPNAACAPNGNYFGFPYTVEESPLVLVSVPWDVTTSYKPGTAQGPEAILRASVQLDFFDFDIPQAWKGGISTWPLERSQQIAELSRKCRPAARRVIESEERGQAPLGQKAEDGNLENDLNQVAQASAFTNRWLYETCLPLLQTGKKIGVVGGDHSSPFGLMKALSRIYDSFGILHLDAHADLREAYEGFQFSHASIMYNALGLKQVSHLVQLGIRDVCQQEQDLAQSRDQNRRILQFPACRIQESLAEGRSWNSICSQIIGSLPEKVYVSFDIDVLEPSLCPHTGTPVPGGLDFGQIRYLLSCLRKSGKEIIGFDLCEVSPDPERPEEEWDGNVGARILYMLSNTLLFSSGNRSI